MALILTFLGKGGVGKTTLAIAAAKKFAIQGQRVLLASQDASPALTQALGTAVGSEVTTISSHLDAVQFQATVLLQQAWDELKRLEAQYLRTPFLKTVYGEELGLLPGMDSILVLDQLGRYDAQYDVIVYDGLGNQETLRMFGVPEIASWYSRRFRQVWAESDVGKTLSPIVQPVATTLLTVSWSTEGMAGPEQALNQRLQDSQRAITDPARVAAYLVTTEDEWAIATAKYLWGSAQQIGLSVGGVLLNHGQAVGNPFAPLPITAIPTVGRDDWQGLMAALPDLRQAIHAPRAITISVPERKVVLFLPGFDKKQVKLTQYGPEITIEAGDQRRNIFLPPELTGLPVTGARFQDGYLIIAFS
jgi:arsenite-transporting ATPase